MFLGMSTFSAFCCYFKRVLETFFPQRKWLCWRTQSCPVCEHSQEEGEVLKLRVMWERCVLGGHPADNECFLLLLPEPQSREEYGKVGQSVVVNWSKTEASGHVNLPTTIWCPQENLAFTCAARFWIEKTCFHFFCTLAERNHVFIFELRNP